MKGAEAVVQFKFRLIEPSKTINAGLLNARFHSIKFQNKNECTIGYGHEP